MVNTKDGVALHCAPVRSLSQASASTTMRATLVVSLLLVALFAASASAQVCPEFTYNLTALIKLNKDCESIKKEGDDCSNGNCASACGKTFAAGSDADYDACVAKGVSKSSLDAYKKAGANCRSCSATTAAIAAVLAAAIAVATYAL